MAAASPRAVVIALTSPHSQRPFSNSKAPTPRFQSLQSLYNTTSTQRLPILHPIKQKSVIVQKRPQHPIIQRGAKRGYLNNISSRHRINCEISNSCGSSLYSILGVEHNVAIPEIKHAYRHLALRFHPDVLCPTADVAEGTQKFVQLQNAYRVLSDPELRADYDYHLTNSSASQTVGFDSNKSGLRMSRSKDHLVRASWKPQWESQIRKLRWGYASAGQAESHRRTWGSRMREQNTPNHTTF